MKKVINKSNFETENTKNKYQSLKLKSHLKARQLKLLQFLLYFPLIPQSNSLLKACNFCSNTITIIL